MSEERVTLRPADPAARLSGAPGTTIELRLAVELAPVGPIVPAGALRLMRSGGLYVRCRPVGGATLLDCPVEPVADHDGQVAVKGELAEGSTVMAPS